MSATLSGVGLLDKVPDWLGPWLVGVGLIGATIFAGLSLYDFAYQRGQRHPTAVPWRLTLGQKGTLQTELAWRFRDWSAHQVDIILSRFAPENADYADDVASAFRAAGWAGNVRESGDDLGPTARGLYVESDHEVAPLAAALVSDALTAAGIDHRPVSHPELGALVCVTIARKRADHGAIA